MIRARRVLAALVLLFVVTTLAPVAALRWHDPWFTWTMVGVWQETGVWPARQPIPLERMGPWLPRAVVASEDSWFWHHHGFSPGGIQRALAATKAGDTRGGSTISQQVAKNALLWQKRSWVRKALEGWYTVWLELLVPKARILELYLNLAQLGPTHFGAHVAARHHFQRDPATLTRLQAAQLAAVLPSPARWSPRGAYAQGKAQQIVANTVPFPGEAGFARMEARAPGVVGWPAWRALLLGRG